ncbi:glycoside hydrolase family 13 protein [Streptomyces sp. NPDC057257]|uniref:glycoside hydrolase family 13 protein n=1 Tax=Streptomyces sp. NPDC057257 TaxID=3346071 RepID=UPI00362F360F
MNAPWWTDAVTYQIYVRSFADSDGDGVGDLNGIRSRLPYLRELGVDAVWLTPCYPSPQHDHGYDVADYTGIEPAYGTLDDFDRLVAEAHDLGLRVLLDIVPNHCSVEHPWFRAALDAGPGSPERERFHFRPGNGDGPPNNWRSMFGGPAWRRTSDGEWFLHLFTPEQPDWNWAHPDVAAMFENVLRFWLDRGVDGFRIDAAQGLHKNPELPDVDDPFEEERIADAVNVHAWNRPEVHEVYRSWRRIADSYTARDGRDRPLIGEITGIGKQHLHEYVQPDQLHQGFFWDLLDSPFDADAYAGTVRRGVEQAARTQSPVTWVLGNHDRVRVATRYGGGAPGEGPGDIVAGTARARAAALLLLALPGPVYIYQGEELALPEVVDLPLDRITDPIYRRTEGRRLGRDGCRIPLPWSGTSAPYGFSTTTDTWLPQPPHFAGYTAEAAQSDPASTWHLYQLALRIRRDLLAEPGPLRLLPTPPGVLAFRRGDGFTFALNTGDTPVDAPHPGTPLLASGPVPEGKLPADTAAWWTD